VSEHGFSIEQLLSGLQRKGIPLPCEMSAFLLLLATEQALMLSASREAAGKAPVLGAGDVWLSEQGEILLEPSRPLGAEIDACKALVALLSDLLVRSATGVPEMLLMLAEHGPSDGAFSLTRLRDDLEASLVPLNRAAMRRVFGRLLREVRRDTERSSAAPPPDARAVDREVNAMLGLELDSASADEPEIDLDADVDEDASPESGLPESLRVERLEHSRKPSTRPAAERSSRSDPARVPPRSDVAARRRPRDAHGKLDEFEQMSTSTSGPGAWIGLGLVLVAAVLVVAYLLFRPGH
jgi:hypothetical protein